MGPARTVVDLRGLLEPHLADLRVAVYGSGGAPSHHLALLALWGGRPEVLYADEISGGRLEQYDAVIFPGGGLAAMAGQLEPLGAAGMTALRSWVEGGGSYLGSCAGSCHPLKMSGAYTQAYPDAAPFQVCAVTPLNAAAGAWGLDSPGTGRLRVMPEAQPLLAGLTETFEIVHYNGPLFPAAPGAAGRVLGAAQFTPFEVSQGHVPELSTLDRATAQGARVAYHERIGAGQVIVFGSHPEFGGSALQLGWLPAVRLLANALRLVEPRAVSAAGDADRSRERLPTGLLEELRQEVVALELLLVQAQSLSARLPDSAPAFLGMSAPALWDAAFAEAQALLRSLERWLQGPPEEPLRGLYLLDRDPKPNQDVGFMGVRQLLGRAQEMAAAATAPSASWPAFTGAYDQLDTHPYHLLVSSYLSACGLVAAATLQLGAFAALNDLPLPDALSPVISS